MDSRVCNLHCTLSTSHRKRLLRVGGEASTRMRMCLVLILVSLHCAEWFSEVALVELASVEIEIAGGLGRHLSGCDF